MFHCRAPSWIDACNPKFQCTLSFSSCDKAGRIYSARVPLCMVRWRHVSQFTTNPEVSGFGVQSADASIQYHRLTVLPFLPCKQLLFQAISTTDPAPAGRVTRHPIKQGHAELGAPLQRPPTSWSQCIQQEHTTAGKRALQVVAGTETPNG